MAALCAYMYCCMPKKSWCVAQVRGKALLHMGRHLHEVLPVTGGERHQLILWARSSTLRKAQCPCCYQNFRQGGELRECVCGPAWNS